MVNLLYFDRTGITTPGHSGPGSHGNEVVLHIPQNPGFKPHHQMQFRVISRIVIGWESYATVEMLRSDLTVAQSVGTVKYTDCISAVGGYPTSQTSVLT